MDFIKGRFIRPGQRVSVYVNLNQQSRFSIVDAEPKSKSETSGLVLGYAESVLIHSAQFKVSESGRQKVLANHRKLVHSSVVGILISVDQPKPQHMDTVVNYFPYVRGDYHTESGVTITQASQVHFESKRCYIQQEDIPLF
jgi:hypothetical protein